MNETAGQAASGPGTLMARLRDETMPLPRETEQGSRPQDPPPRPSDTNPFIPGKLAQILRKVLSKEPAGRYRTADQFGRILSAYRESSLQATGPIPGPVSLVDLAPVPPAYEQPTALYQQQPGSRPTVSAAPELSLIHISEPTRPY